MRPTIMHAVVCTLAMLLAALAAQSARADDLVATRPGVMCASAEALGRLTLPDGSSRSAALRPRPEDLRVKAEGGCIDIPRGARVTVLQAHHNTSVVSFDPGDGGGAHSFTVPNIDFAAAQAASGPPTGGTLLGTSARLGASVIADNPDWCSRMPQFRVVVQDPAVLGSPDLDELLQQLGLLVISRRCPSAEGAQFIGSARGGAPGWHGTASAARRWTLASPPAPPSPGLALNLDDLGARGAAPQGASASGTPAQPTPPAAGSEPHSAAVTAPPPAGPEVFAPPFTVSACPLAYPGSPEARSPLVCTCNAAEVDTGAVFGSGPYSFDSVPCRAARHAGVFDTVGRNRRVLPALRATKPDRQRPQRGRLWPPKQRHGRLRGARGDPADGRLRPRPGYEGSRSGAHSRHPHAQW